jgi:hypothetical protein
MATRCVARSVSTGGAAGLTGWRAETAARVAANRSRVASGHSAALTHREGHRIQAASRRALFPGIDALPASRITANGAIFARRRAAGDAGYGQRLPTHDVRTPLSGLGADPTARVATLPPGRTRRRPALHSGRSIGWSSRDRRRCCHHGLGRCWSGRPRTRCRAVIAHRRNAVEHLAVEARVFDTGRLGDALDVVRVHDERGGGHCRWRRRNDHRRSVVVHCHERGQRECGDHERHGCPEHRFGHVRTRANGRPSATRSAWRFASLCWSVPCNGYRRCRVSPTHPKSKCSPSSHARSPSSS